MTICFFKKPGIDMNLKEIRHELINLEGGKVVPLSNISELCTDDECFWNNIKFTFKRDYRIYDKLLLDIHLSRSKKIKSQILKYILRFLTIGYLNSNDLRYFNEFLWLNSNEDKYREVNRANFYKNLDKNGFHKFSLASIHEVNDNISGIKRYINNNNRINQNGNEIKNVALLGTPLAYKGIANNLHKDMEYKIIMFSRDQKSKLKSRVKSSRVLSEVYFKLKGVQCNYQIIDSSPKDLELYNLLKKYKFDLAVSRVGFIIRDNLINSVRLGILNDHLGILPYVRGKSTLEYSMIYGLPIGATLHLIDSGIDTGKIIKIFTYDINYNDFRNMKELKSFIIGKSDERIISTIDYIKSNGVITYNNPYEKGLQHFVMHPALIHYIERGIMRVR